MTIVDDLTITQYERTKIVLELQYDAEGVYTGIRARAHLVLRNADGGVLYTRDVDLGLTTAEESTLKSRWDARAAQLETLSGWTEYVTPGESP